MKKLIRNIAATAATVIALFAASAGAALTYNHNETFVLGGSR
jgi:hypothetical protein